MGAIEGRSGFRISQSNSIVQFEGLSKTLTFMLALAVGLVCSFAVSWPVTSFAENASQIISAGPSKIATTYYVDARTGDDSNSGTTPDKPWKTLDKVSSTTFNPGDHILLRAGSIWEGDGAYKNGSAAGDSLKASGNTLWPKGNGTKEAPIVIDAYDLDDSGNAIYTVSSRPVINGNGTYGIGSKRTLPSAPVMIYNQDGFEINNLEVTNVPKASRDDKDAYKKQGDAQRAGILIYETDQDRQFSHIRVSGCYVHDVQSEHPNKATDNSVGGSKATGGIIILGAYLNPDGIWQVGGANSNNTALPESDKGKSRVKIDDILIERNYVKRTGLEGIRTSVPSDNKSSGNTFNQTLTNVTFRNNYLEDIAGDGIVLSQTVGGLVENNVLKRPCNADFGKTNYAGAWVMASTNVIFQRNEVYGIRYGYNDGEAFDADLACKNVTFQYNYSHDNAGGFMLFMGDQRDSTVRYNISANDGAGNKGTSADIPGLAQGYTYDSQSIIHYWNKTDNATMPTIYNNTIYVGNGYDTALYGEGNKNDNTGVIARLYNNLLVKEGAGKLRFLTHYDVDGSAAVETRMGSTSSPISKLVLNNAFPAQMVTGLYKESDFTSGKNQIIGNDADPIIALQGSTEYAADLAAQSESSLKEGSTPSEVSAFTSSERLGERTAMFKLVQGSVAEAAGRTVSGSPEKDFFGGSTVGRAIDLGAHQASNVETKTIVKQVEEVSVKTTAGFYPVLPDTVKVTFTDVVGDKQTDRTENVSVIWDTIAADRYLEAGTFTVEGTVKGLDNKAVATITVTGSAGTGEFSHDFIATQNAYVQADKQTQAFGAQKGSVTQGFDSQSALKSPLGANVTNNYVIKIKNATNTAYNRRGLVQFDLSSFTGDFSSIKEAKVRLHIARYDLYNKAPGSNLTQQFLNTTRYIDLYDIGNDWTSANVTWSSVPDMEKAAANHGPLGKAETVEPTYATHKPIAHQLFSNADLVAAGDTVEIDVTDYIRGLPTGTKAVSFLVDSPYSKLSGSNVDNGGFDALTTDGAQAVFEAYQAGLLPATKKDANGKDVAIKVDSATSLAPSLLLSDAYPKSIEAVNVDTMIGTAPQLPESVNVTYSDGSVRKAAVAWNDVEESNYAAEGSFQVQGRLKDNGQPVTATVTVKADHITGFHVPEPIKADVGTALEDLPLPKNVAADVLRADGTVETADIPVKAWRDNEIAYNPLVAGTYYLIANADDLELPAGMVVDGDAHPRIEVVLSDKVIDPDSDTLTVGTFNIAANKKPDVDTLRELTERYAIEVVGLQEVDRNTDRNGYDMLAEFGGSTYPYTYFSKAIDYGGGAYGIGTASRYELSDSSTTQVDSTGMDEQRVFQRSVLTKAGRTIAFYNTHLSWEELSQRKVQMEQLKAAIKADPTPYKVVVGDFNADQNHHEFDSFLEELDMVNGGEGTWFDTFNGSDASMKVNSVDNILYTRNMRLDERKMVETKLSDHNLLYATFTLLDAPRVSYEWLRTQIDAGKDIAEGNYTEASWRDFQSALDAAKVAYETEGLTQQQVDEAARSLFMSIENLETYNLALNRPTTASGTEVTDGRFTAAMATDGVVSKDSRWSGAKKDEQWLQVDLGSVKQISEAIIRFESQAPKWELQISVDGENWTSVHNEENGPINGDAEDVQCSFAPVDARYVRYVQHKMWTHASNKKQYSTSIYELEVYARIDIKKVSITQFEDVIGIGDSFTLKTDIEPAEAAHKALSYTSSNDDVATVSPDGTVTGRAAGTAVITVASADDPSISVAREVRVIDGYALAFQGGDLSIDARAKRFLTYKVLGSEPDDMKVTYTVEDEDVASVDGATGLLSAKAAGTTTVHLLANGVDQDTIQVTVNAPTYRSDYATMQDRWIERITGGSDLDLSDSDVMAYVANISTEGENLWNDLDKSEGRTRLWPKVETDTTSADYTTQFTKIKKLTLAFGTKGSKLYQNRELLDDIVSAVRFMAIDKKYNGTYTTGNWWDWQIGCTQPLCDTLMVISDYVNYDQIEPAVKAIEGYAKAPSKRFNGYTETGANRTDTGLAVLGSAIVARNDARMKLVQDEVPDVMKLVTAGDGMYADGSVVQHTKVAYTGAYGNELIKGVGRISSIIAGTSWDITDPRIENVYETVLNGYIPLMHRGQQMSMVNGRSISRGPGLNNFTTEFESGSETISNVLLIAQFAPEKYRSAYLSAVKGWLEDEAAWKDSFDFYGHARDFDALLQAKSVMANESVKATRWTGMKVYGSMDRVVQATGSYEAGLSMYSKRIYNYEGGVGSGSENKRGWHTGSGMLYVYNGDLAQYGEGFWPTVDAYRLPGTTVDTRELGVGANQSTASPQSWVGGVTDGTNGAAGMVYNANGMSGMNVKANKSWFFLPGQIVALGSNITGTTDASIETTIENRMLTDDSNKVTINGQAYDGSDTESEMDAGSYAHLSGTGEGNDLGYYLLAGGSVKASIEERSGTYADINGVFPDSKVYTKKYFKMGVDHGQNATDGSYAYVILPGASEDETAGYADRAVTVLRNDDTAHAIRDDKDGILAFNTWPESEVTIDGFTVDNSASVFVQRKDGEVTISLANPKQNGVSIKLRIADDKVGSVVSLSDGVTRNDDGSFTFNTKGLAGATQTVVLETAEEDLITPLGTSVRFTAGAAKGLGGLRFGYEFRLPAGATWDDVDWEKSGWGYGLSEDEAKSNAKHLGIVNKKPVGDHYVANIVFTGIPAPDYKTPLYAQARLVLKDGRKYVSDPVQSDTPYAWAGRVLEEGSGATDAERSLAQAVRDAADAAA